MTLRQTTPFLLCLFCAAIAFGASVPTASALPFLKKKPVEDPAVEQVKTYQPPPENAVTFYCDPYRKEAALLDKKPGYLKPFYIPRRLWLMSEHRKCKDGLMEQERIYLKHADIEQSPSLPKLKTDMPPVDVKPGEGAPEDATSKPE